MSKNMIDFLKGIKNSVKYSMTYGSYYDGTIDEELVFADSRSGNELAGNVLRLMLAIDRLYAHKYRIVLATEWGKRGKIRKMLDHYGLSNVKLCYYHTKSYFRNAYSAKYLISDSTLANLFVKKEGQIYLNTWHGTPYKCMGIDNIADCLKMDNVQRNFFMADYLLYPNEYCMEKMTKAYSLPGLYSGKVILEGYPRCSVFQDKNRGTAVRKLFGLTDKRVYFYMPTFRHNDTDETGRSQTEILKDYLDELDKVLADDEVFYVKLHNLVQKELMRMSFSAYKHIKAFPEGIEPYDFLTGVDCLITDYSSIFYDFAVTKKKIVMFVYDEETYYKNRNMYEQKTPLPFTRTKTATELLKALREDKDYDDAEFIKTYSPYDHADSAERIIKHVFEGADTVKEISFADGKQHTFAYVGDINKYISVNENGKDLKTDETWFSIARKNEGELSATERDRLPAGNLYELEGLPHYTVSEFFAWGNEKGGTKSDKNRKLVDRMFEREVKRCFTGLDFTDFVLYDDKNKFVAELMNHKKNYT